MNFGLIPEFIGRLPVVSAVHQLRREDLVQILVEPKNALVRQYQRFFGYDSVELVFTDDALWEIADKALARETGARGLRSIIESALLDVMFELPSRGDVSKCVITKETISRGPQADARDERRRRAGRARRGRRRLGLTPRSPDGVSERRACRACWGAPCRGSGTFRRDAARAVASPRNPTVRVRNSLVPSARRAIEAALCWARSRFFHSTSAPRATTMRAGRNVKSSISISGPTVALPPTAAGTAPARAEGPRLP